MRVREHVCECVCTCVARLAVAHNLESNMLFQFTEVFLAQREAMRDSVLS